MPSPGLQLSLHLHVFANPEILQIPSSWVFPQASITYVGLIKSLVTGDWFNLQPPSPLWREREGGGTESSNHKVGSTSNQPPALGAFQDTSLTTKDTLSPNTQEIPRVLGPVNQKLQMKIEHISPKTQHHQRLPLCSKQCTSPFVGMVLLCRSKSHATKPFS